MICMTSTLTIVLFLNGKVLAPRREISNVNFSFMSQVISILMEKKKVEIREELR